MESPIDESRRPPGLDESPESQESPEAQESGWTLAAHLSLLVIVVGIPGFLGPLVVFLLKPAQNGRVASAAREALNFGLSLLLYAVILFVLAVAAILNGAWGGVTAAALGGLALFLASLMFPVIAAVKVSGGERFRYPLTIRFF